MSVLLAYVCVLLEEVIRSLNWPSPVVVNHHVGAGTDPGPLQEQVFFLLSGLSSLHLFFFFFSVGALVDVDCIPNERPVP